MKKQRKTNVEFITHLMEYSKHGALMQAFIIQAIEQYSEQVKAGIPEDAKPEPAEEGHVSFAVHPQAWRGCAVEILDALTERFNER